MASVLEQEIEMTVERSARREAWQEVLLPLFTVMPKNSYGSLGHQAARFLLHRAFSKRFGWFVRGLEPSNASWQGRPWEPKEEHEWVPDYLQDIIEKGRGEMGIDLNSLIAFASTLEDFIATESDGRLKMAFEVHGIALDADVDHTILTSLLRSYMVSYMMAGNLTVTDLEDFEDFKVEFAETDTDWPKTAEWLQSFEAENLEVNQLQGLHFFKSLQKLVHKLGQQHHSFFNKDCQTLKASFGEMELFKPGRVRLSSFYQMGKIGRWDFEEKSDYLRTLGALDDSNPQDIQIITPNYVMSRVNCMEPSDFYVMCCRNECEDLMSHIEDKVGSSWADPQQLAVLVSELPSDTVAAPRTLSPTLLQRLDSVAANNGGKVPIHGRLFAQWMHHAYPRECPFPHAAGTTSPLTPNEWMLETGQSNSSVSREELDALLANNDQVNSSNENAHGADLPWSEDEELIVVYGASHDTGRQTSARAPSLLKSGRPTYLLAVASAVVLMLMFFREYVALRQKSHEATSSVLHAQDPQICLRIRKHLRLTAATWAAVTLAWSCDLLDTGFFACAMLGGIAISVFRPKSNTAIGMHNK